jgi:hypothetical protein
MELRLQNAIYRPNAWIFSQGYLWVKKYLHFPVMCMKESIMRHQETKSLGMLYDACSILSDVNCILGAYRTAYRWRSLAYEIDSSTDEIVEDMISISQMSGITDSLDLYVNQYLALSQTHEKSDLYLGIDAENKATQLLLDKLNMFHPEEVIETIMNADDEKLNLIKILAYGAAQDTDVFFEMFQSYVRTKAEVESRFLYYCPSVLLDSQLFWHAIVEHKPEIATSTCELRTVISNSNSPSQFQLKCSKEYEDMPPHLHLARATQDVETMKALASQFPTWKDPMLCIDFFRARGRMPKWREFYCLNEPEPNHFLTKKRPERFE